MNKTPGPAPVYLLAGGPHSRRAKRDPLLTRAIASCGVTGPCRHSRVMSLCHDTRASFRSFALKLLLKNKDIA